MFYLFLQTWIWVLVGFLLGVATGLLVARAMVRRQAERPAEGRIPDPAGRAG